MRHGEILVLASRGWDTDNRHVDESKEEIRCSENMRVGSGEVASGRAGMEMPCAGC